MKYEKTKELLDEVLLLLEKYGCASFTTEGGKYINEIAASEAGKFWDMYHLFEEFSRDFLETLWVEEMKEIPGVEVALLSLGKMVPYLQTKAISKFIEEFRKENKS